MFTTKSLYIAKKNKIQSIDKKQKLHEHTNQTV
jgi:hypothetical protein